MMHLNLRSTSDIQLCNAQVYRQKNNLKAHVIAHKWLHYYYVYLFIIMYICYTYYYVYMHM